jgi:ribosomal protein S18 acetylase RimI-like enzyme
MTITCKAIGLAEARRLPSIRSEFTTERVYRVERVQLVDGVEWHLREATLAEPYYKLYDTGQVDTWLESYTESAKAEDFKFLLATNGKKPVGILTWQLEAWNNTFALLDIRVDASSRRHGVGGNLVQSLKDAVVKQNVRGISVETQCNNYPAVSFYRKNGFTLSGVNDHLYSNRDLATQDVAVFLFWENPRD